ncbi:MAG: SDR family oxidoreductase [Verrucomicrobiota bacterium]
MTSPGYPSSSSLSPPRIAVVTGGTAGVGRATARLLAQKGCAVAVLARGQERLEVTVEELRAKGARALGISVDVADAAAVEDAAERIEEELGPISTWINCAMTSVFAPADEIKPEEYRRVTDVCYHGCVHGTLAALRRMKPRDRGVIVQAGSALAYRGIPLQAAYCAAKHAIRGFCDSLRAELLHDGSRVQLSMVQLPALNTPQFGWVRSRLPERAQPLPPIFQPEVAARALVKAAEHPKREYIVGNSSRGAIWGNKLFPALGDRYLAKSGFASQQTGEPVNQLRPDNLFEPVPGAGQGAHGRYNQQARAETTVERIVPLAVGAGIVAGVSVLRLVGRPLRMGR